MATSIVIIEDEKAIREMIRFALQREGHDVLEAEDAQTATEVLASQRPDLMIVDWMLPDVSGIELIRRFRRDELLRDVPVIMLTARGEESDKVKGLESGADDYMTKPVAIRELHARIKALLRRSRDFREEEVLEQGPLRLDLASHQLYVENEPVHLGQTEYKLLQFFMMHSGRVYSRAQLLDFVWGRDVYVEERTVDVHVLRLRKALKPSGHEGMIQTVRGAGYRFVETATQ
ncbi:MAG: phosphate regulon transcriptional regulator PhoB [Gammaproteobacteria bacterium]|jgi:two-component system, OmpR family, phosphate regulon response regulator PhoB